MAGSVRFEPIQRLLAAARRNGRSRLSEPETKTILALAGFCVPEERTVTSAREAARAAHEIGFPIVLKVVSRDLPHKSDVGGVRLGLQSPEAVRRAYEGMLADVRAGSRHAQIDGVLVQQQLHGAEVILGATTDLQFGPVMVFGVGGTAVEALGDVAFRLIPIDEHDARVMLEEIKAAPLLKGFRGSAPVNRRALVAALLRLSRLVARFHGVIQDIEINPLVVAGARTVAVDAVAVISSAEPT